MHTSTKSKTSIGSSQKGFSMVELLVAMVIFLIVTASIYGLLQVGRIDRNRSSRRSDILKNARVAIHLIGRDALNAGLGYNRIGALAPDNFNSTTFGIPADNDDERDFITSVIPANDFRTNSLNRTPGLKTDFVAFCYRDMDFNDKDLLKLEKIDPSGSPDTPYIRTEEATGAVDAGITLNHLYLIESETSQVAIMATGVPADNQIEAAPTDPLGLNQPLNGVGQGGSVLRECNPPVGDPPVYDTNCTDYIANLKHFFIVSYEVRTDGTLVRKTYGNNADGLSPADQIQEQPLAYNVEDLQFEYVLEDGTVTNAPTIASPGPDNDWDTVGDNVPDTANLVRQINITLRVQSTENDEQTGMPESITLTASFSTRNMTYTAG